MSNAYAIGQCEVEIANASAELVRALYDVNDHGASVLRRYIFWWVLVVSPVVAYTLAGDTVRAIAAVMVAAMGGA